MEVGYKGTLVRGSATLSTSVANAEILTGTPIMVNFTLTTDQPCTIKFNGQDAVFVRANQTVLIPRCNSVKIVEAGITYNWIAILG